MGGGGNCQQKCHNLLPYDFTTKCSICSHAIQFKYRLELLAQKIMIILLNEQFFLQSEILFELAISLTSFCS